MTAASSVGLDKNSSPWPCSPPALVLPWNRALCGYSQHSEFVVLGCWAALLFSGLSVAKALLAEALPLAAQAAPGPKATAEGSRKRVTLPHHGICSPEPLAPRDWGRSRCDHWEPLSLPLTPLTAPKAPHTRDGGRFWVGIAGAPASHMPWFISSVTTLSLSHSATSRVSQWETKWVPLGSRTFHPAPSCVPP